MSLPSSTMTVRLVFGLVNRVRENEMSCELVSGEFYTKRDEIKYAGSLRELLGHKRVMLSGR